MAPTSTLVSRLKVHLKLSISRLRIVQQKDQAIAKQQRRAMAQLLEQGKIASAHIRVENIIRSDLTTELHEILELYCELLLARIGLLEPATCDPGLEEAVKSIIYAAPRTDIKELGQVRGLLVAKFGKEFEGAAMAGVGDGKGVGVSERVVKRLSVEPPGEKLVESYLRSIAEAYDVSYGDEDEREQAGADGDGDGDGDRDGNGNGNDNDEEGGRGGGQKQKTLSAPLATDALTANLHTMTPPRDLGPKSPVSIAPPSPSTDNANPRVKVPGAGTLGRTLELKPSVRMKKSSLGGGAGGGGKEDGAGGGIAGSVRKPEGEVPDVDDLEKRFSLLKR